jgi:hypothetical protein
LCRSKLSNQWFSSYKEKAELWNVNLAEKKFVQLM